MSGAIQPITKEKTRNRVSEIELPKQPSATSIFDKMLKRESVTVEKDKESSPSDESKNFSDAFSEGVFKEEV